MKISVILKLIMEIIISTMRIMIMIMVMIMPTNNSSNGNDTKYNNNNNDDNAIITLSIENYLNKTSLTFSMIF